MANLISRLNLSLQDEVMLIVWGIALLIFLIFFIILAVRLSRSIKACEANKSRTNQYLAAVPADKIGTIQAIYQNTRKSLGIAMILSIVGGTFGFQRIYLGKRRSAVAMFLLFWTGVPTVISLFDLTAMPGTVSEYNRNVAESLYNQLAAPKME